MKQHLVIIGAGHAAAQLILNLVQSQYGAAITVITEDSHAFYQRPPLSKQFLKDDQASIQSLIGPALLERHGITTLASTHITGIDTDEKCVQLASGENVGYTQLVFATGSEPRHLADLPSDLDNVHRLRSYTDAQALRHALSPATTVAIIGAGFIGLEIAATARELGKEVVIFEREARVLPHRVSPEIATFLLAQHRQQGVNVHLESTDINYQIAKQRITSITCNGARVTPDVVVIGIGGAPRTTLAQQIGIHCDNGILVDENMQTSVPDIYAIGDCMISRGVGQTSFRRLESVQNANDSARVLAHHLTGQVAPPAAIPWFWSTQGNIHLQIAGLPQAHTETVNKKTDNPDSFSILHFAEERLVCVETINHPADHLAARKLIALADQPGRAQLADKNLSLRSHLV